MIRNTLTVIVVYGLTGISAQVRGAIVYVDDSATGTQDGTTWCDGYRSLQDALANAGFEDTIRVAQGTYRPDDGAGLTPGDRTLAFEPVNQVTIEGGYAGCLTVNPDARDIVLHKTILTGDLLGDDGADFANRSDNSYHVVSFTTPFGLIRLDGLYIRGGNAVDAGLEHNTGGGGILDMGSAFLEILRCRIEDNIALVGGGMSCRETINLRIESTFFTENRATGIEQFEGGGGLALLSVAVHSSAAVISNSQFVGNSAVQGGGVFHHFSGAEYSNCTLVHNSADTLAGGIYFDAPLMANLANMILWDNSDATGISEAAQLNEHAAVDVGFSNIAGWSGTMRGAGNFGEDPMFVDPMGPDGVAGTGDEDLALQSGSPSIDAGVDSGAARDLLDLDGDGDTVEPVPFDITGASRFVDVPGIEGAIVDIGAHEAAGTGCATVADCADLDNDGRRDDNCVFWQCSDGICIGTDIMFADMGGSFGACQADGSADGNDRFHALNCFGNLDPGGGPGDEYLCEPDTPNAMNVDARGAYHGGCAPDGVCDGNDAFAALRAFGNTATCSCPLDGAPAPAVEPRIVGKAELYLGAPVRQLRPGDLIDVDVWLANDLPDLRGYQLHMAVSGGTGGALELVDIAIKQATVMDTDTRVRATQRVRTASDTTWRVFNVNTTQMLVGTDDPGMAVTAGYLATFTYHATKDAAGDFVVELLSDRTDATHRTFMFPTPAHGVIETIPPDPVVIAID